MPLATPGAASGTLWLAIAARPRTSVLRIGLTAGCSSPAVFERLIDANWIPRVARRSCVFRQLFF
jgi:hypothetical protein